MLRAYARQYIARTLRNLRCAIRDGDTVRFDNPIKIYARNELIRQCATSVLEQEGIIWPLEHLSRLP